MAATAGAAPVLRVHRGDVEALAAAGTTQYHVFPGTTHTVCLLTLPNGFTVTGESSCVDPRTFDAATGRRMAYERARDKLWALEGYRLRCMTDNP